MALDQDGINEQNRKKYSHAETDQGKLNAMVNYMTNTSGTDQSTTNKVFLEQQNLK